MELRNQFMIATPFQEERKFGVILGWNLVKEYVRESGITDKTGSALITGNVLNTGSGGAADFRGLKQVSTEN